jgi:hypothetical protein
MEMLPEEIDGGFVTGHDFQSCRKPNMGRASAPATEIIPQAAKAALNF